MRVPRNERVSGNSGRQAAGRKRSVRGSVPAPEADSQGEAERRCILSGEIAPRESLIRLAISPEGPDGVAMVVPDVLARAPGRGAWIGVTRAELEAAMAKGRLKGALARAFKGAKLAVPDNLAELIEIALVRAFTERLGLALRSGALLMGSDRIGENARMGRVEWLAHARDAGLDGNRKLDQAWRVGREAEGSGQCGVTLPLDRATLSVALGRDNVVHLALTDRALAERLAPLTARLFHYLGWPPGAEQNGTPEPSAGAPADMTTN